MLLTRLPLNQLMDSAIIVAAIILNPRARRKRRLLEENIVATLVDQTNEEGESILTSGERTREPSCARDMEKQDDRVQGPDRKGEV